MEIHDDARAHVATGHATARPPRHQRDGLRPGHVYQRHEVAHVLGDCHGFGYDAKRAGAFAIGAPCSPIGVKFSGESGRGVDRHLSM